MKTTGLAASEIESSTAAIATATSPKSSQGDKSFGDFEGSDYQGSLESSSQLSEHKGTQFSARDGKSSIKDNEAAAKPFSISSLSSSEDRSPTPSELGLPKTNRKLYPELTEISLEEAAEKITKETLNKAISEIKSEEEFPSNDKKTNTEKFNDSLLAESGKIERSASIPGAIKELNQNKIGKFDIPQTINTMETILEVENSKNDLPDSFFKRFTNEIAKCVAYCCYPPKKEVPNQINQSNTAQTSEESYTLTQQQRDEVSQGLEAALRGAESTTNSNLQSTVQKVVNEMVKDVSQKIIISQMMSELTGEIFEKAAQIAASENRKTSSTSLASNAVGVFADSNANTKKEKTFDDAQTQTELNIEGQITIISPRQTAQQTTTSQQTEERATLQKAEYKPSPAPQTPRTEQLKSPDRPTAKVIC